MNRHRSRKGAPGIVDVARRAGVSPATVSRFFNSPDVVRAPTKAKIEKAAGELGYIRDRMAGALHNRFSGTIGLIVPTINNAIFSELIEAFSTRLRRHERTMLIASHNYDLDLEVAIVRSLLERRIDGVALVGHDHADAALAMLEMRNIPVISLWNYRRDAVLPCIGADNCEAARQITQHLIDLGHNNFALLFPQADSNDRARDRKNGALAAIRAARLATPHQLVCPYDFAAAKSLALALIRAEMPTAFICGNDVIAQGVVYAAHHAGLNIPQQLSVAGIGDFPGAAEIEPGITTVRMPAKRIGEMAADAIVEMSETGARPGNTGIAVDAELIIRSSTAKPERYSSSGIQRPGV